MRRFRTAASSLAVAVPVIVVVATGRSAVAAATVTAPEAAAMAAAAAVPAAAAAAVPAAAAAAVPAAAAAADAAAAALGDARAVQAHGVGVDEQAHVGERARGCRCVSEHARSDAVGGVVSEAGGGAAEGRQVRGARRGQHHGLRREGQSG